MFVVNRRATKRSDYCGMLCSVAALRRLHPDHSLVITQDYTNSILSFDGAYAVLHPDKERIARLRFIAMSRRSAVRGIVADEPVFAAYVVAYKVCPQVATRIISC